MKLQLEKSEKPNTVMEYKKHRMEILLREKRALFERKEQRDNMIDQKTWAAAEKFRTGQVRLQEKRKIVEAK